MKKYRIKYIGKYNAFYPQYRSWCGLWMHYYYDGTPTRVSRDTEIDATAFITARIAEDNAKDYIIDIDSPGGKIPTMPSHVKPPRPPKGNGDKLKRHRVANDISIYEMSNALGVSEQYIIDIESGRLTPYFSEVKHYAEITNDDHNKIFQDVFFRVGRK